MPIFLTWHSILSVMLELDTCSHEGLPLFLKRCASTHTILSFVWYVSVCVRVCARVHVSHTHKRERDEAILIHLSAVQA